MNINLSEQSSGPDITTLAEGTYQGVISGAWYIGKHENNFDPQNITVNERIMFNIEVNELIEDEGDYKGKRYTVLKEINIPKYFGDKATLVHLASAAFGKKLVAKDFEGFDTDTLIGKNIMISTGLTSGGKAKVTSFSMLMKGMQTILPELSSDMPDWVKSKAIEGGVQLDESATSAEPSNASMSGDSLYNESAPEDTLPF